MSQYIPTEQNLGTGHPKLFCTACGEYNHWRKDCPYDCHCDNCDSDSLATHMCRAPPKPSPTPSPQPVICVYCGSSEHRLMECRTVLETTERKVMYPVQHPVGTPETNNVNLPQHQVKVHKSPMLGPEIVTNLGTTHGDLRQADNNSNSHNITHRANQILIRNFPYRDYRYSDQLRQTRFNKKQNQMYSPYHFAPSPTLSAGSDLLSHSILQLADMQSHSLEIFAAQQKSQLDVYQELTRSNKEKEHDALFTLIPVFDGDRTQCEQWLDDMDQATRISG